MKLSLIQELLAENPKRSFLGQAFFTRLEDGVPDKMKMRWDYLTMNYSYQEAESGSSV